MKKEYKKLFFLGAMGCGVCGAFPFLAGHHAVKSKIHELNYMIDEPIDLKLGGYSAKNKNYNTP